MQVKPHEYAENLCNTDDRNVLTQRIGACRWFLARCQNDSAAALRQEAAIKALNNKLYTTKIN